jgi:uncharacterized protein (DUF1684 family)
MTELEQFRNAYGGDPPPWDTGAPQPALVAVADRIRGRVLDAGCGSGENALLLAPDCDVVGIDGAEEGIAIARKKAVDRGLRARFEVADALDAWQLGSFDAVVDCGLFHVFGDESRARYVATLAEIVQPGGVVVLLCFSDQVPGTFGPRRVSEAELRGCFASGWSIEELHRSEYHTRRGAVPAWRLLARRVGPDPEHRAEVDAWADARDRRMRSLDGWLSVTVRVPAADGDEVAIGIVETRGLEVAIHRPDGSRVSLPAVVDGVRWEASNVGEEGIVVRARDPNSPLIRTYRGIERFPVDPRLRIPAAIERVSDGVHRIRFALDGQERTLLSTFLDGTALSIPFRDLTCGESTYDGGRFALVRQESGAWILDFNRAFNPPCALNELINCPFAPPENWLPVRIAGGEKLVTTAAE